MAAINFRLELWHQLFLTTIMALASPPRHQHLHAVLSLCTVDLFSNYLVAGIDFGVLTFVFFLLIT